MNEWKRFKDPSGEFYYFNTKTKQSSKNRPKGYEEVQDVIKLLKVPVFALPLRNSWFLVICKDGSKFYFDGDKNVSVYKLEDEPSKELLAGVDPMLLALLVGTARGFTSRVERDVYQEIYGLLSEESPSPEDKLSAEQVSVDQTGIEEPQSMNLANDLEKLQSRPSVEPPNALIASYESSDEESERSSAEESSQDQNVPLAGIEGAASPRSGSFQPEADLSEGPSPTKYHYLAHIISKADIKTDTLFTDVKKGNKALFRSLDIDSTLTKKEQHAFGSKVIAYYKRMDKSQRIELFQKVIQKKLKLPPLSEELRQLVLQDMPSDSFDIETHLLELENRLLILEDQPNAFIQDDVMYYVLGIKDKLISLKESLRQLYSI